MGKSDDKQYHMARIVSTLPGSYLITLDGFVDAISLC